MTRRLANTGLTLLIVGLMTYAVAMVIFPAFTGTQAVTIDRNSMQRVLPFGSLVFIKEAETYNVNDIVTFHRGSDLVTHQVVALVPNPATAELDGEWLLTKGTENTDPDEPINKSQIVGRVLYLMPYMGIAVKTLNAPNVIVFFVLLAISLYWLGRKPKETQQRTDERVLQP